MYRKMTALILLLAMVASLAACGQNGAQSDISQNPASTAEEAAAQQPEAAAEENVPAEEAPAVEAPVELESTGVADEYFSARDFEVGYAEPVTVTLSDGGSRGDGEGVTVDGDTVTITKEGVYRLTGSLSNGQVVVELPDTDKAQLVLDNVTVSCDGNAALYIVEADKVFLTTTADSENSFHTTGKFNVPEDSGIDAAVFSKADVTMNGKGALDISCETGHGVVSKDDLKITSGSYQITAAGKALSGKDSVRIADGTFHITSDGDGICSDNDEDADRGYIYIADGDFTIASGKDGMDAHNTLTIMDGTFHITTGGGYENAPIKTDDKWGWYDTTTEDTEEEAISMKGLKSDSEVLVQGGTFTINAADDAVHSNGSVTISGGTLEICSGDDGVHGDSVTAISGGAVNVSYSYEGIEGALIQVSGGEIRVVSADDGVNAAGGADGSGLYNWFTGETEETIEATEEFDLSAGSGIEISGGSLYVASEGDGLDTNTTLTITGGDIRVDGPVSSGNGFFDFEMGPAEIHGGTIVAVGPTDFSENFHATSTQGSILQLLSSYHAAGTKITLTDASGNEIVSYTPEKDFQAVVISTPELAVGSTYTLTVGDESYTIEMTTLLYGTGGGRGGKGGRSKD